MIRKILTTYAARLDEYLARSHRQPEGVAEVGLIGSAGEQCPNKLVVSLVNLEREASGDGGYMQRAATGYAGRRQPLLLNMHIMMAAVYEDKRYAEALSVLSDAHVHYGSAQHLDDHGRTVLPFVHLQGSRTDSGFHRNHVRQQHGRNYGCKNINVIKS